MSNPGQLIQQAQAEIAAVFHSTDAEGLAGLAEAVILSARVFTAGAGRSGLLAKAFAMRLTQIGVAVHAVGDATVPAIGTGDLLFLVSGSGRTASLRTLADAARKQDASVAILTYHADSPLANLADFVATLNVPLDASRPGGVGGGQRLGTLFDQCAMLALDAIARMVADRSGVDDAAMQRRHANLE